MAIELEGGDPLGSQPGDQAGGDTPGIVGRQHCLGCPCALSPVLGPPAAEGVGQQLQPASLVGRNRQLVARRHGRTGVVDLVVGTGLAGPGPRPGRRRAGRHLPPATGRQDCQNHGGETGDDGPISHDDTVRVTDRAVRADGPAVPRRVSSPTSLSRRGRRKAGEVEVAIRRRAVEDIHQ